MNKTKGGLKGASEGNVGGRMSMEGLWVKGRHTKQEGRFFRGMVEL